MKNGKVVFFFGVFISVMLGLIVSLDPGAVCKLDPDNPPDTIWRYPALCFTLWAFGPPLGIIIAAIGIVISAGAPKNTIIKFSLGTIGAYIFISYANGPVPHIPVLFGIGGAFILMFYFLILWKNARILKENPPKLAGYTFLLIGFWFTCGLGSRQYQPALGAGESPIDIITYFVLAMLFFWLGEKKRS